MSKIYCFPHTTDANPYQQLMMEGLRRAGLEVDYGHQHRLFGPLLTALRPGEYLHFDWPERFYFRRSGLLTAINGWVFVLQLLFIRKVLGKKIIWTLHNLSPHIGLHPRTSRAVYSRLGRWGVDKVRVFADSSRIRLREIFGIPRQRVIVVPEGDYTDYYTDRRSRSEARAELSMDESDFILLQLGSIRPYKGILETIEHFKNYHFERPWHYYIVGAAWDEAYTRQVVAAAAGDERIHIEPHQVEEADLDRYFNAADAVICPYNKIENSGAVILAMGFRKAVVAPRIGVLPERLSSQPELLYVTSPREALVKLDQLSHEELHAIGQRNYLAVRQHRWEDFAICFGQKLPLPPQPSSVNQPLSNPTS